jgi:hypothetical protein
VAGGMNSVVSPATFLRGHRCGMGFQPMEPTGKMPVHE